MPVLKLAWAARQRQAQEFAALRVSQGMRKQPSGHWLGPRKNRHRIDVWWTEESGALTEFMADLSDWVEPPQEEVPSPAHCQGEAPPRPPRIKTHRIDVWWREDELDALEASFMADLSKD
jgi:hypothetical protein